MVRRPSLHPLLLEGPYRRRGRFSRRSANWPVVALFALALLIWPALFFGLGRVNQRIADEATRPYHAIRHEAVPVPTPQGPIVEVRP